MTSKASVEAVIAAAGLQFVPGKGGIAVGAVSGGVLVQNLNAKGEPIRFNEKQMVVLRANFPKQLVADLERRLVRNTETGRRIAMLEERQKSGLFSVMESLDPDRSMPALGTLGPGKAELIPRTYASLDLSDAKRPSIAIWGSEFPIPGKGVRLDEGMFVFDIEPAIAQRIKNGERIADVLNGSAPLKVKNARILYFDDNKAIQGAKRLEHHLKSIASLEAWASHVFSSFKLEVSGSIFLHVEDEFADSPGVLFDKIAEVFRKRRHRFFLSLNANAKFEQGVFKGFETDGSSKVTKMMTRFSAGEGQQVLKRLDDLILQISKAMSKVKMTPP